MLLLLVVAIYVIMLVSQIPIEAFKANLLELYIIQQKSPESNWFKKDDQQSILEFD